MKNLLALARLSLHKVLTMHPFLGVGLILGLFLGTPAFSQAQAPQCQELFSDNGPALIPMNPLYRGEEKGLYVDPLTKTPWRVRYFSEKVKARFELFIRDGLLVDKDGNKAQSAYDHESMSWENALIVIDASHRIFHLPFEIRGRYHHSSLSAGKDVIFAGTAAFHQGFLRELSDRSGHYKPNSQQALSALRDLTSRGLDISQLRLTGYFVKEVSPHISLSPREVPKYFPSLFGPTK
jgi:hypothetical protein